MPFRKYEPRFRARDLSREGLLPLVFLVLSRVIVPLASLILS